MNKINALWDSRDEEQWEHALEQYWDRVKPANVAIEKRMELLTVAEIREMDADRWHRFLRDEYFKWKYTAPNRLATTTASLEKQVKKIGEDGLLIFRNDILASSQLGILEGIKAAKQIGGLGTAGASGLMALLFPEKFGTVDQFVVEALLLIDGLREAAALKEMKPEGLRPKDAVILIDIMTSQARILNEAFGSESWTPRKIDKMLWAVRGESKA